MLDGKDVILDSSLDPKKEKLPPAIVSFEWIFFMGLLLSQYIALGQMLLSSFPGGVPGLIWAGVSNMLLGAWQPVSALIVMGIYGGKSRRTYLIGLAVVLLLSVFFFFLTPPNQKPQFAAAFLVVAGHLLAWFYCSVCYQDSKKRKAALAR